MSEERDYEGLGGWLILVAIGVVITPIRILMLLMTQYSEIFAAGLWETLTSRESAAYNPLWGPIIIGEVIINCALLLVWLYMAYLFFSKDIKFPKWYIGVSIISLIIIVADAFAITLVLPGEPVFDAYTAREFFRGVVAVVIWVPYMLVSKRVKATFVN